MCLEAGEKLTSAKRQCFEWKRCWRGGCMNLLREIPEIGGKRVRRRGEAFRKEPSENLSLDVSGE